MQKWFIHGENLKKRFEHYLGEDVMKDSNNFVQFACFNINFWNFRNSIKMPCSTYLIWQCIEENHLALTKAKSRTLLEGDDVSSKLRYR